MTDLTQTDNTSTCSSHRAWIIVREDMHKYKYMHMKLKLLSLTCYNERHLRAGYIDQLIINVHLTLKEDSIIFQCSGSDRQPSNNDTIFICVIVSGW